MNKTFLLAAALVLPAGAFAAEVGANILGIKYDDGSMLLQTSVERPETGCLSAVVYQFRLAPTAPADLKTFARRAATENYPVTLSYTPSACTAAGVATLTGIQFQD